ncbi:hypothetical protein SKAU_G00140680 [Synaphobranchus kaupii]|uniref:EGF-like domain-containing protein n=1 Tax=Synaphobranchus kaupii TaxID=118154 RepID=A0A9Q1J245_SYNKA|nr:hypothetical protein SKAU_G00140680 [Synaphobranchus kaupii]
MASPAGLLLCATLLCCSLSCMTLADEDELPYFTREKAEKSLEPLKAGLELVKNIVEVVDKTDWERFLKKMVTVSSLAPGVGTLVGAFINCALVYLPQTDPVLDKLKEEFANVNMKLDSVSMEISNLKTEVEWSNYASIYSQDESNILNSWKKWEEFISYCSSAGTIQTQKESDLAKMRMAERFTTYYENSATENSVYSLYGHLAVRQPALSVNLLDILVKRFQCDVQVVETYSKYFRVLLWKGLLLNQLYYTLKGFDADAKAQQSIQQLYDVIIAQQKTIVYCVQNYERYMKTDVEGITNAALSSGTDNMQLARKIKTALDRKYNWYDWIIAVIPSEEGHTFLNYTMVRVATVTVAVAHYQRGPINYVYSFVSEKCNELEVACRSPTELLKCMIRYAEKDFIPLKHRTAALQASETSEISETPEPFYKRPCYFPGTLFTYSGTISLYMKSHKQFTLSDPRKPFQFPSCENSGTPTQILDTTGFVCECRYGFYGERCENDLELDKRKIRVGVDMPQPVTDLTSMDGKLTKITKALVHCSKRQYL